MSDSAKAHRAAGKGTYTVNVSPKETLAIEISAGVMYSFVRNPEYSVGDSSGMLVVAETSDDYTEFSAAVALDVTLSPWPTKEQDLSCRSVCHPIATISPFSGIGLRSGNQFTFSGGYVYQRVNELADGFSVGDTLDAAEDLATDDKFDGGLYLMLGYQF